MCSRLGNETGRSVSSRGEGSSRQAVAGSALPRGPKACMFPRRLNLTTHSVRARARGTAELNLEESHTGLPPAAPGTPTDSAPDLQGLYPGWSAWPPQPLLALSSPPARLLPSPYREPPNLRPAPPPTVQVLVLIGLTLCVRIGNKARAEL